MDLLGMAVEGISVGGVETCLILPGLRLAFDMGGSREAAVAIPTVLFTHTHVDHVAGIFWHAAMRAMRRLPPPRYVVAPESREPLGEMFELWRRLDCSHLPCEIVALAPGERLRLEAGWSVEPFRAPHRVRCQGYALFHEKSVLIPELRGLPEAEIRRLKIERGVAVSQPVESCELAFTGDTRIEVLEQAELVRRARRLLIEVTFLDERVTVEEARSKGHIHLDEVLERAELLQNEAIAFTHFSSRYHAREVRELLDERLPPALRERCQPFLEGRR